MDLLGRRVVIDRFDGEYRFLSNFYLCPVSYNGVLFPSVEHAYQAAKAVGRTESEWVAEASSPYEAKKRGRKVRLREDWEELKDGIMLRLVRDKFERNPDLRDKLLATAPCELIEGNTWNDREWGVCKGEGLNKLGRILMRVRSELADKQLGSEKAEKQESTMEKNKNRVVVESGDRRIVFNFQTEALVVEKMDGRDALDVPRWKALGRVKKDGFHSEMTDQLGIPNPREMSLLILWLIREVVQRAEAEARRARSVVNPTTGKVELERPPEPEENGTVPLLSED